MRVVLKVKKKGILIIPKKLREISGINEGDEVIVEAEKGIIRITPLKPRIVDVDPKLIEDFLREELRLEEKKYESIFEE